MQEIDFPEIDDDNSTKERTSWLDCWISLLRSFKKIRMLIWQQILAYCKKTSQFKTSQTGQTDNGLIA